MIVDYKNKNPCPIKRQRSDLCGTTLIAGGAGHSKLCPVTGAAGGAYCPARELGPLLGGDLRRLVPPPCTVRRLSAGMFGRVLVLFCADIHITSAILSAFYSNVKEKIREKHFSRTSVPVVGLEPTRVLAQRILNPQRLPFHHTGMYKW